VDPKAALDELMELSSQVQAAAVLSAEGVLASTFPDEGRAERFAAAVRRLLGAAEEVAGRGSPSRLRAATSSGGLFVVREGGHTIAATTGTSPTVGLLLYDLRSCLRALAEPEEARAAR